MKIIKESKKNIKEVITALEDGAVLVLPTDTVYGLVCDAANKKSVEKIFEIKKRDKSNTLPVFVKDLEQAKELAIINDQVVEYLKNSKITVILKAKNKKLSPLVYKNKTIGIRIPDYKFLNLILEEFKKPLAQTSANLSGREAASKISDVISQFGKEEILIIDAGNLPNNKPSAIIDLSKNKISVLRK